MAHGLAGLEVSRVLYGVLQREVAVSMALQPIVELASGAPVGHEALFRVPGHPGVQPPALWAQAARAGLLEPLEDRVAEACADLHTEDLLFVNVHPAAAGVVHRWRQVPSAVVELTEVASVDEDVVQALKVAGIPFALDDLGTGHANVRELVAFRPDYVKVDRSVVAGCDRDGYRRAFLGHLTRYAAEVRATVIAEGVETAGEAGVLRAVGITLAQGYWFGPPVLY